MRSRSDRRHRTPIRACDAVRRSAWLVLLVLLVGQVAGGIAHAFTMRAGADRATLGPVCATRTDDGDPGRPLSEQPAGACNGCVSCASAAKGGPPPQAILLHVSSPPEAYTLRPANRRPPRARRAWAAARSRAPPVRA